MPYLASVFFFFVSIVLLHLHIGTCFIVLVFSLSFLLVRDTALVMCIIFRSPQWCWRCRCSKKRKKKNHYVINQSVIPQSTNGESTKSVFFLTSASKNYFQRFLVFVGFTKSSPKSDESLSDRTVDKVTPRCFVKGKFCSWWHFYTPTPFVDIWKNSCKVSKECEPPVAVSNKWHFYQKVFPKATTQSILQVICATVQLQP